MSISAVGAVGLLLDLAMGGLQFASALEEFRKGRNPDETPAEATAAFIASMVAAIRKEAAADAAIAGWLAVHNV